MNFRKKCLYLAVASVFTAQTAFAQLGQTQESGLVSALQIKQAIKEQEPRVLRAIRNAIISAEPVAGEGIEVTVDPDTLAPRIALKNGPIVGRMFRGGMVAYVDEETGDALVIELGRTGRHSTMWSAGAEVGAGSQWGSGGGAVNTALTMASAIALGAQAPAAELVYGISVDSKGGTCAGQLPGGQSADQHTECYSGFTVASPSDMLRIGANLTTINEALRALDAPEIAQGTYMTSFTDPLSNKQAVVDFADGRAEVRMVPQQTSEAIVLPTK